MSNFKTLNGTLEYFLQMLVIYTVHTYTGDYICSLQEIVAALVLYTSNY